LSGSGDNDYHHDDDSEGQFCNAVTPKLTLKRIPSKEMTSDPISVPNPSASSSDDCDLEPDDTDESSSTVRVEFKIELEDDKEYFSEEEITVPNVIQSVDYTLNEDPLNTNSGETIVIILIRTSAICTFVQLDFIFKYTKLFI